MRKQVGDLTLIKSLGKSYFGEIFLTEKLGKKGFLTTRKMERSFVERSENIYKLNNEINILKTNKNPNLEKLIDYKKTDNNIYLVTEYCNGGNLSKCLKKYIQIFKRPFTEEIVQYLMRQILNGLSFLHSKNIIHRDLRLDNILVYFNSDKDKASLNMLNSKIKISEFSFSKILKNPSHQLTKSIVGTPLYTSPDILDGMVNKTSNLEYNQKVDIWSLGVLCYEMLVGYCPFLGNNLQDLYDKIKQGFYSLPNNLSKEAASFIGSMLIIDDNQRLSCKELLKHDFLNKNVKEFQHLDTMDFPGVITQKGHYIIFNLRLNQPNNQLGEEKKEIIKPVNTPEEKKVEIKNTPNCNNNTEDKIQKTIYKKKIILPKNNKKSQQNKNNKLYIHNPYRGAAPTFHC